MAPFQREGDVPWVDMGWRQEHVTAGTTASPTTKCKGSSSQLAVRSTQGGTLPQKVENSSEKEGIQVGKTRSLA